MTKPLEIRLPGQLVKFDFAIGQSVLIRGSGLDADVVSLMQSVDGPQYCLVWWYNGQRFSNWVFARKITAK